MSVAAKDMVPGDLYVPVNPDITHKFFVISRRNGIPLRKNGIEMMLLRSDLKVFYTDDYYALDLQYIRFRSC